MGHNLRKRP